MVPSYHAWCAPPSPTVHSSYSTPHLNLDFSLILHSYCIYSLSILMTLAQGMGPVRLYSRSEERLVVLYLRLSALTLLESYRDFSKAVTGLSQTRQRDSFIDRSINLMAHIHFRA